MFQPSAAARRHILEVDVEVVVGLVVEHMSRDPRTISLLYGHPLVEARIEGLGLRGPKP